MKQFIRAGRTGNWQNYLVIRQILNLFSATAHFQYAKSARLYLQLMDEPPIEFPWLYNLFQHGYYTIRRSDRFWSGLLTDLAIEQSLMRTVNSRKGLKCCTQLTVKCSKINYKLSTKTPLGANNCSCRKIGLPCISVNCHGKKLHQRFKI